jgi:hypothetical protein
MTKILTEEELNERNRKLVFENDELLAEIMMRVRYEGFLRSVINCKGNLRDSEDFEWFKNCYAELQKPLEGPK